MFIHRRRISNPLNRFHSKKSATTTKYNEASFWRPKVRLMLQIFLAFGFSIQSGSFLQMYFQYPSTVEMEIRQPWEFEMPALTICNLNEIRSTPYCERYPNKCGNKDSDPDFCTKFVEYCSFVHSFKMVPNMSISEFLNISRYEQQSFGHQIKDLIKSCQIEIDGLVTNVNNCSFSGVPTLVPALGTSKEVPFNCYMVNSLFQKPNEKPPFLSVSSTISLVLNLEISEYHPSHRSRGALLSIHAPRHVPSPASEGLFLNMGSIYKIYVTMAEKNLLPPPYRSNCSNYEQQWRDNGGIGPVTEKMCGELCKLKRSLENYECAERRIDYPHNHTICNHNIPYFASMYRYQCARSCSAPCRIRKYELEVQEENTGGRRGECANENDLSCAISVHIIFENMEITSFSYVTRYEPIGLLSVLGGYVGVWLGISFLTVYDFVEDLLFRLLAAIRRRWRRNSVVVPAEEAEETRSPPHHESSFTTDITRQSEM